ncbi:MAG: glucose dehydrogenase, partial [Candidatus Omnitrophica bacterium]|nr:glucose dehydrogenase [Candidatus Omnitrophota bacterium]
MLRPLTLLATILILISLTARASDYNPPIAPASNDGQERIKAFKTDPGLEIELVAAEPMLANPVAFYIDNQGKVYVAETFRHFRGVTDMRRHREWLVDDLACETIEDRLISMKKNLGEEFASYSVDHDRIKVLEDTNGDGIMDRSTVFADGFKDSLAGIGAGVLEERGTVYYTCIPDLWALRDKDGDGQSDERTLLSSGYGVHISLLGHD